MRTRLTIAMLLGLIAASGCGGDSNGGPGALAPSPGQPTDPDQTSLTGSVEEAPQAGIVVCLDRDADLRCGDGEPRASTDAHGGYTIALPAGTATAGRHVVAEIPVAVADASGIPADVSRPAAPAGAPALVLAAPAEQSRAIHALSTLVSASMLANPGQDAAAAQAAVRSRARLPQALALLGPYEQAAGNGNDATGGARELGRLVAPALRAGLQAAPTQAPLAVTEAAAGAIEASLARYIDATTGRPYRTVTARTIASETTAVTGAATTCPILPLAQMRIDTAGAAPIVDRETYLPTTVTVAGAPDAPEGFTAAAEIRGRGNSTRLQAPKKP